MTTVDRRAWRKASYSGNGEGCVEVKFGNDTVYIRDSKYLRDPANDPAIQPIIAVSIHQWKTFRDVVAGRSTEATEPAITNDSISTVLHAADGTVLIYTPVEWDAFTAGVLAGEFDRPQVSV